MTSESPDAVEFYDQHGQDMTLVWDEARVDSLLPNGQGRDVLDAECANEPGLRTVNPCHSIVAHSVT